MFSHIAAMCATCAQYMLNMLYFSKQFAVQTTNMLRPMPLPYIRYNSTRKLVQRSAVHILTALLLLISLQSICVETRETEHFEIVMPFAPPNVVSAVHWGKICLMNFYLKYNPYAVGFLIKSDFRVREVYRYVQNIQDSSIYTCNNFVENKEKKESILKPEISFISLQ